MMLLLYDNDLFLTEKRKSLNLQEEDLLLKDLGMMHYILSMEVWTREVCSRDPEEVHDDGLQGHDHTYGIKHEAIECCFIRDS